MAKTNIQSPEEARTLLKGFRRINILGAVVTIALAANFFASLPIGYTYALVVLFVAIGTYASYYYSKVGRALNYARIMNMPKYFYFVGGDRSGRDYFALTKALKIIAGLIDPPAGDEALAGTIAGPETITFDKTFLKNLLWAILIALALFVIIVLAIEKGLI